MNATIPATKGKYLASLLEDEVNQTQYEDKISGNGD